MTERSWVKFSVYRVGFSGQGKLCLAQNELAGPHPGARPGAGAQRRELGGQALAHEASLL